MPQWCHLLEAKSFSRKPNLTGCIKLDFKFKKHWCHLVGKHLCIYQAADQHTALAEDWHWRNTGTTAPLPRVPHGKCHPQSTANTTTRSCFKPKAVPTQKDLPALENILTMKDFFSSAVWKRPWPNLEVVSMNFRSIFSRARRLVCTSRDYKRDARWVQQQHPFNLPESWQLSPHHLQNTT